MKIFKSVKLICISALMFVLVSCANIQGLIGKIDGQKAAKEKEIAALQVDFNQKLSAKEREIQATNDAYIKSLKGQMGGAGNSFYAQDMLFRTIITPNRTDLLFHNYGEEGWTALGHLMPDYETMIKINDRLKRELDEAQTSLVDLQKNHEAALNQNQKLVDASKVLSDKIASLQKDITDLKTAYTDTMTKKQGELNDLNNKIIGLEKQRADDAESIRAAKMKFSMILGAVALAALAGAIWSPVFKDKCGLLSAICAGAAIGIWYITPFIVGLITSIAAVALIAWAIYKYHVSDKANNAFINFVQEKKLNNPALFGDQMKADLQAWMTKYKKDKDGKIITVPDQSVLNLVDNKLIATDKK